MEEKNSEQLAILCEKIYSNCLERGFVAHEIMRCLCVVMARVMYEGSGCNKDMEMHKKALRTLQKKIAHAIEEMIKLN